MAVPSARNSGLERMSKVQPGFELASRMVRMALREVSAGCKEMADYDDNGEDQSVGERTHSAVLHGTVDFSTTILLEVETSAIRLVASWR